MVDLFTAALGDIAADERQSLHLAGFLERVCIEASARGGEVVPANYNAPGQLVISGDVPTVQAAMALAREAGAKKSVQLNVSGAFHSPLMEPAEPGLRVQLDDVA